MKYIYQSQRPGHNTSYTKKAYKNLTVVKQQRVQQKSDKINKGRTLTTPKNTTGSAYTKGMADPQADDPENVDSSQKKKNTPAKKSIACIALRKDTRQPTYNFASFQLSLALLITEKTTMSGLPVSNGYSPMMAPCV
jgi:hypothetical protein